MKFFTRVWEKPYADSAKRAVEGLWSKYKPAEEVLARASDESIEGGSQSIRYAFEQAMADSGVEDELHRYLREKPALEYNVGSGAAGALNW